jgi:hypothetical protein
MRTELLLVVTMPEVPASASAVYRFPTLTSTRSVLEELLRDWGIEGLSARAVMADGLRLPDGRHLGLVHGELIEEGARTAVIIGESGSCLRVLLAGTEAIIREIVADSAECGWTAETVPLAELPRPVLAGHPPAPIGEKLRFLARALAESESGAPNAIHFGQQICPRCQDHPLALDPADDERSRLTEARICIACAHFEQLGLGGSPT